MFPVARAVLLSMREREDFVGVLKIVCWESKTRLLQYACCGLHFIDSAACVLSFDHSAPLHIRAGTEPNATIGQLVKTWTPTGCGTTNISDTKKAHTQLVAGKFDAYMHA